MIEFNYLTHKYRIEFVDKIKGTDEFQTVWGEIDYDKNLIEIAINENENNMKETLLHELFHLINVKSSVFQSCSNETKCNTLACQLFYLLSKNQELLEYLFGFSKEESNKYGLQTVLKS